MTYIHIKIVMNMFILLSTTHYTLHRLKNEKQNVDNHNGVDNRSISVFTY